MRCAVLYGTESLGKRTNLVNLYKDRVSATFVDTTLQIFNVCYEQVIAYKLATVTDKICEDLPAFPVIFSHTVLDRVDRIFINELLEVFSLLL